MCTFLHHMKSTANQEVQQTEVRVCKIILESAMSIKMKMSQKQCPVALKCVQRNKKLQQKRRNTQQTEKK